MRPSQKTVKCIDWRQVICDLEGLGMSWSQIAGECGWNDQSRSSPMDGGKTWIHRLKNVPDTQPMFHEGALLLGLWVGRMGKPLSDLPRNEYRYVRNAQGRITALPMIDRQVAPDAIGADSHRAPE